MLHGGGQYNWNPLTCGQYTSSCKIIRHDECIVLIPELENDNVVGSLSMHGFSVFKVHLDIEKVLNQTLSSIPKRRTKWENIQPGPLIPFQVVYPKDSNPMYQIKLNKTKWSDEFGLLQ
eukprot:7270411-Ditylum_brightwellii.AAC.1